MSADGLGEFSRPRRRLSSCGKSLTAREIYIGTRRRRERLLDRRRKQAAFRDPHKRLDNFDFNFNPKMNRSLVCDLAACAFVDKREDGLFLGPGRHGRGTGWRDKLGKPPASVTL